MSDPATRVRAGRLRQECDGSLPSWQSSAGESLYRTYAEAAVAPLMATKGVSGPGLDLRIGGEAGTTASATASAATSRRRSGRPALPRAAGELSPADRRSLVAFYIRLLEGAYAHLPLKRARYGFDPVQRLRILQTRIGELSFPAFREEFNSVLVQLRDQHTWIDWGTALSRSRKVAILPFLLEAYEGTDGFRYVATQVFLFPANDPRLANASGPPCPVQGNDHGFVRGVEIEYWNGMRIGAAVAQHAQQFASGGRTDSARALALSSMTHRPLRYFDQPKEEWVDVGFRPFDEASQTLGPLQWARFYWREMSNSAVEAARKVDERSAVAGSAARASARRARRSINMIAAEIQKAKLLRFAPHALKGRARTPTPGASREETPAPGASHSRPGSEVRAVSARFRTLMRAAELEGWPGSNGPVGYLRLYSFDTDDAEAYRDEVARLLRKLPQRGLIIDVRGNGGGTINAAEWTLQLLTPGHVEPTRFAILASDFTRAFCGHRSNQASYSEWLPSLTHAVRTGEPYSSAEPISSVESCNDVGQCYGGPVLLVSDATTYSSGDLFCAGFVDNRIGTYVCVDESTGAGGACVYSYSEDLREAGKASVKLGRLPREMDLAISFFRATRCGALLGTAIEDVGVSGGERYRMSRDDLLHDNRDMLAHCVDLLGKMERSAMTVTARGDRMKVATEGLDQVDIRIGRRTLASRTPDAAGVVIIDDVPRRAVWVEVRGSLRGKLKQRRRLKLPDRS